MLVWPLMREQAPVGWAPTDHGRRQRCWGAREVRDLVRRVRKPFPPGGRAVASPSILCVVPACGMSVELPTGAPSIPIQVAQANVPEPTAAMSGTVHWPLTQVTGSIVLCPSASTASTGPAPCSCPAAAQGHCPSRWGQRRPVLPERERTPGGQIASTVRPHAPTVPRERAGDPQGAEPDIRVCEQFPLARSERIEPIRRAAARMSHLTSSSISPYDRPLPTAPRRVAIETRQWHPRPVRRGAASVSWLAGAAGSRASRG